MVIHHANLVSTQELDYIEEQVRFHHSSSESVVSGGDLLLVKTFMKPTALIKAKTLVESSSSHTTNNDRTTETADFTYLAGKHIYAFCGIGNPESLKLLLSQYCQSPVTIQAFDDHHKFTKADFECIREEAMQLQGCATAGPGEKVVLVTTEKDFCRCEGDMLAELGDLDLFVLRCELDIVDGEVAFLEALPKTKAHSSAI